MTLCARFGSREESERPAQMVDGAEEDPGQLEQPHGPWHSLGWGDRDGQRAEGSQPSAWPGRPGEEMARAVLRAQHGRQNPLPSRPHIFGGLKQ